MSIGSNYDGYILQQKLSVYFNLIETFNLEKIIDVNLSLDNNCNMDLLRWNKLEITLNRNKLIDLERVCYIPFLFNDNNIKITIR